MHLPKPGLKSGLVAAIAIVALLVTACSVAPEQQGPYAVSVATGLQPRLSPADAVAITIAYLNDQHPDPPPVTPHVSAVWAIRAADARSHDGCIPAQEGAAIVWITKGVGDYLNLSDHPWSRNSSEVASDPLAMACVGPGPAGTIVIDDATGRILGVYPYMGPDYPHPTGG